MILQVRIEFPEGNNKDEKGKALEDLLRNVMEQQRYDVTQRVRFTGTEIDLLCKHKDRSEDTALVECKARQTLDAGDIKNFTHDLLVTHRAKHGYFVHTTEMQQQIAGIKEELEKSYGQQVTFVGPNKLIEWLIDSKLINPISSVDFESLKPTKRILLYTPSRRYWITILSGGTAPTHYYLSGADEKKCNTDDYESVKACLKDELNGLEIFSSKKASIASTDQVPTIDIIAEIQESDEWTDLRPVGSKYFVGRSAATQALYNFVKAPLTNKDAKRIFFVESKSGWGKSSLLAQLRARSKNKHNRNTLFVFAVDSRSSDSIAFIGKAVEKMITESERFGFIPKELAAKFRIPSWLDILSDECSIELFDWLVEHNKIMVLIFDQFEDVFRKNDLFRAFHKLMMDIATASSNIVIGFSWKSEINIPMDNPAYSLWQQARDHAIPFEIEKFSYSEINGVINQLQTESNKQVPSSLRRRLQENSQGFPWLIKKLATHCYHELKKGLSPEDLVDQNLNVQNLFDSDKDQLTPEETRALKHIAKRSYDGDTFDVTEIDDSINQEILNRLLDKRLIIRTGSKYNIYWDIFRDYIVEDEPPKLAESFLIRQYPPPCIDTLKELLNKDKCKVEEIMKSTNVSEGTALNRLRELRNIGAIVKTDEYYSSRSRVKTEDDFKTFIKERLEQHVIVNELSKLKSDIITEIIISAVLIREYSNFKFSKKTWQTYGKFFGIWLKYCEIDFGGRLVVSNTKRRTIDSNTYTPQTRANRVLNTINYVIDAKSGKRPTERKYDKPLYDLKALGFLMYEGDKLFLTPKGLQLFDAPIKERSRLLALQALRVDKIKKAVDALELENNDPSKTFSDSVKNMLDYIGSDSYRELTKSVLKNWARFVLDNIPFNAK